MQKVILYTDGGCRGNGRRRNVGGIGGILMHPKTGARREYSEGFLDTTNNRMEMLAVITGLRMLKEPCSVSVYSDSAYLVNAVNKNWIGGWKKAGWTRNGKELKNPDLWQELDSLMSTHRVAFIKVKGHASDKENNRADALAGAAMDRAERGGV